MDIDDILADIDREALPQESLDLQELTRAWVTERVAPELLPYPDALMERVSARIRRQIELVEEQTGNMDPKTNFSLIIIQTELERFKFLVRSFLRARIAKVLIRVRKQYLSAHHALLSSHYQASFLSQFPPLLQRLDDTAGGVSMVDAPDLDSAVFVRVLKDVGVVSVEGTDTIFEMQRGDVFVVRWRVVRERVLVGDAELI
ncbi:GINS complex, Sld5 component [Rhizodiscina lignyota]|uniref:DNA replication complex GINS protein SLD5 n=1 Tax=Rhizodiscina lignyota TaxID=1504668 RepID=A0A9P4MDF8_9PEZI|nr:GINS complex, Sld5 component [Rhizodiscina lignyota]